MNDTLLSIQEAAQLLGVSAKTLRRWEDRGILIPTRTAGNQRRYSKLQIASFKKPNLYTKVEGGETETLFSEVDKLIQVPIPAPKSTPFFQQQRAQMSRFHSVIPNSFRNQLLQEKMLKLVQHDRLKIFFIAGVMVVIMTATTYGLYRNYTTLFGSTGTNVQVISQEQVGQGSVLAEKTSELDFTFGVNIQSIFRKPAEFTDTISVGGLATMSGGIVTNGADIDAGTGSVFGSNLLYGIASGSGIIIGTGQNPSISNNGILTFGGEIGDITLGSGLTLSGKTLSNSDKGSAVNTFKTIKAGGTSFSAGSNGDTLEFAAGTGISLSASTSDKKITITGESSTGLTGWTDDGTIVRLTTASDNVGIGTTTTPSKLTVGTSGGFQVNDSGNAVAINGATYSWPSSYASGSRLLQNDGSGNLTWASVSGGSITADSLDFTELIDAMTLDANLTISATASNYSINIDSNTLFVDTANNRIGIGTATPGTALDVNGSISNSNGNVVIADTTDLGSATTGINISTLGLITDSDGNVIIGDTVDLGSASTGLNVTTAGVISDIDGAAVEVNDDIQVTGNDILDSGATSRITLGATTILTNTALTLSGTTTLTGSSLTSITGGATAIDFTEFDVSASTGSITINDGGDAGNVSVEGTILDINSLDFVGVGAITTGGSTDLTLSPAGNNVILSSGVVLNVGATAQAYNFFAADTSGASTPDGAGDLYIQDELEVDGTTRFNNVTYTWPGADAGASGYALTSNGSGTLSWTDLNAGGSVGPWTTSGNTLYPDLSIYKLGIGTTTGASIISQLYVTRTQADGATGKALAIFNQTESQDVLTASSSGTPVFTVTNGGNIKLLEASGATYYGTIAVADLAADKTYNLPSMSASSADICLTTGNCAGVGGNGDITAVGSMTSGDVFADSTADDDWLGLGASAGRIEFDDQSTDEVNILSANVGIGTTAPGAGLDNWKTYSSATTAEEYGQRNLTTYSIADTGLKEGLRLDTRSTLTTGTQASVTGAFSLIRASGNGGTTTDATGFKTRVDTSTGHTITNAYGLYVANGASTGTMTNQYGLYLESMTSASTQNYAIYSAGGKSYFGGNVGIGDSSPSSLLEVGDGTDSLQVSSVGDLTFVDADGAASITGPSGGALSVVAGTAQALTLTGNLGSTWSTSNGVLTISGDDGLILTAASTAGIVGNFPDNIANALDFQEGSNNYININTTNSSEAIQLGNTTTNPTLTLLGSGVTTLGGDLAVNGATSADITTSTTTATIFNGTATTLSLGGAATTLNIGPTGSGVGNIVLAGGSADTGCTLNEATGDLTCSGNITGSSSGNVGFWKRTAGNLSPATLNDTISATTSAAVAMTITQTGAFNALLVEDQASDTSPFVIAADGNVGIGTTSPVNNVDFYAAAGSNFTFALRDGDVANPFTAFVNPISTNAYGGLNIGISDAGGLSVDGYSDTDATGLILRGFIGSSNPTDTIPATVFRSYRFDGVDREASLANGETAFQFQNNTTSLVTILGGGNVGIGSTGPTAKLDVTQTTNAAAFNLTANSATTAIPITINTTGLTTAASLVYNSTNVNTAGGTQSVLDLNFTNNPSSSANGLRGIDLNLDDATALGNTLNGVFSNVALTGNAAKDGRAYYGNVSSSSTTADTLYAGYLETSVTGIMTTGTRNVYGLLSQPTAGAESTGGTTNVYGVYSKASGDVGAGGTVNAYGLYAANGTYDTDGTSTAYGLYIEDISGADTNIDLNFSASPTVRIGDAGVLTFTEAGGNNTLCTLTDSSNVGNLTCTGNITGASSGTVGYWTRTAGNLSPATLNDTVSATTSAAVAMTITQTGAFNALLVEDQATDSTPFVIASDGNVGIGSTSPAAKLDIAHTGTTTNGFALAANSLTTGYASTITSTSTSLSSGRLLNLDWSPAAHSTASGDLMRITMNSYANTTGNFFNIVDSGSSVFRVSETLFETSLPSSFTAAGDVSVAYDLNFTNPTASYINSAAPLYIRAGETFNSSDLTLQTYNTGNIVLQTTTTGNTLVPGGNVGIGTTAPASQLAVRKLTSTSYADIDILNDLGGHLQLINYGSAYVGNNDFGVAAASTATVESGYPLYIGTFAAQPLSFATNSTVKMTILSGGNVGIGTTGPSALLNVAGNTNIDGNLKLRVTADAATSTRGIEMIPAAFNGTQIIRGYNNSSGALSLRGFNTGTSADTMMINIDPTATTGFIGFNTGNGVTGTERMRIDNTGNVGIGTTTPTGTLEVTKSYSNTNANVILAQPTFNTTVTAANYYNSLRTYATVVVNSAITNSGYIRGGFLSALRESTSDNGTLAELTGLALQYGHSNSLSTATATSTSAYGLLIQPYQGGASSTITNAYGIYLDSPVQTGATVTNNYGIYQAGSTIKNYFAGNVGIGTTAPTSNIVGGSRTLDISSSGNTQLTLHSTTTAQESSIATTGVGIYIDVAGHATASNNAIYFRTSNTNSSYAPTERMRITSDGNVGIGTTTTTSYKLTVNGEPAANGYTAWTNYSDSRLKKDIAYIESNILDKVLQLKPAQFNYNSTTGYDQATLDRRITGFIAQDLLGNFPEMVGITSVNGKDYYDTNLSALPIYLVQAVKELNNKVDGIQISEAGNVEIFERESNKFAIKKQDGSILTRIGAYSEATIANVKAGVITAQKTITTSLTASAASITQLATESLTVGSENVTIAGLSLRSYITQIVNQELRIKNQEEFVSPIASRAAFLESILASGSGTLNTLSFADLDVKNATVSGDLMVLGRTTLTDLGVTGNINAGVISVHGIDGEINTISGDLKLQTFGIGGVDILSGKVKISKTGDVTIEETLSAKTVKTENLVVEETTDPDNATIGTGTITPGTKFATINSTKVKSGSKVFVTPRTKTGGQPVIVTTIVSGVSFKVEVEATYTQDIDFDWWIVN